MTRAPSPSIPHQLLRIARDIKLSHTLFALPFALLATFLAAGWADRLPSPGEFALILLCMVFARTYAMATNRWADSEIDANNPRTVGRALPSGAVRKQTVQATLLASVIGFVLSAAGFLVFYDNSWPVILAPAVIILLGGYSYTKRFTLLCHVVLGLALASSPVAAAIAIEPGYLTRPGVWLLACMVLCWVAGFDILYALQDMAFDRASGLHSIPSRLGAGPALWISRALHALSAALLVMFGLIDPQLGLPFAIAVGLTLALLLFEHALVWGGTTKRLNMAFFTVNGVISIVLGAAGIADVLITR